MNDQLSNGTIPSGYPALAPVSGSGADVEAQLGVSTEELRSMIKPLVILMHRKRLPYITIKLNAGIATVLTVKPPNDQAQARGTEI